MNISTFDPAASSAQLQRPSAAASAVQTTSGTKNNSTITSSDFLVLLVTQLKNQDPTQPVDPAAYVQQLVGVNSLEQLIDMNKELTTIGTNLNTTTTTTTKV